MSAIKNFVSKKSDQIDGSVAILVVIGALLVSGFNVASAAPSNAPSEQIKSVVTGSTGVSLNSEGGIGISISDDADTFPTVGE